ncbi:transcription factor IIA, alpha/beta subunit-domain-containing protein [Phascolomyces articulosus]|uniref:Transcription initiation factor IIA large subunit n=1 Tax=Phascolomyces articulosus TaxID=60185 RepID=A0AAD5K4K6_9FUNG|nr:transcription factor IIA, alpha/beta subunit-domain-containing protein [Phascolomyces articulosus]
MSNAIVSNVYRYVIDEVISQVRGEFEDMGIDEAVLQELQRSWEAKVARSRVANFGFSDEAYYDEDGEEQPQQQQQQQQQAQQQQQQSQQVNMGAGGEAQQLQYPSVIIFFFLFRSFLFCI